MGWSRVDDACVGKEGNGWEGERFLRGGEGTVSPPPCSLTPTLRYLSSLPLRAVEGHS